MKRTIQNPDDHLVIHDATSITLGVVLGAATGAASSSPELGAAVTMIICTAGIAAMKIGPVRRGINRTAMAVAEVKR